MRPFAAVFLPIVILLICGTCRAAQQEAAAPDPSVAEKAVGVILKHYSINALALNPTTGQALPRDGAWSIARTTPTSCPQGTQSCLKVFYSVPAASVHCSWVVLMNAGNTDGTFLEENEDEERYFLRKLSSSEAKPLVKTRTKPGYPPIAMAAHVNGSVIMDAIVSESGLVQKVVVLSGPEMLRAASIEAAQKWTFTPMTAGMKPLPYDVQLTFDFRTMGPHTGSVAMIP